MTGERFRIFFRRLASLVRPRSLDADLDEEIRAHIEMATEEYLRRGLGPEEARRRARIDFGGVDQVKEWHRDARSLAWVGELGRDARLGIRRLRRRPGFALVAVLTLGLAIGANGSIFGVVDAVLIEPLPYPGSDRLVAIWETNPDGNQRNVVTRGNYMDWRDEADSFEAVGGYRGGASWTVGGADGAPFRATGTLATPETFDVLGVPAALGRTFLPDEGVPGGEPVVVMSRGLWERRFGSDPGIVGRRIQIEGAPVTVVGVMPEGFAFPSPELELWMPWVLGEEDRANRRSHNLMVVARLAAGTTIERARERMDAIAARNTELYSEDMTGWGVNVQPFHADLVASARPTLVALLGVTVLVLLLACANLANLLLAEGLSRERDGALMRALGAGPARLVRQRLVESGLIALLGGATGLALTWLGLRAFVALAPAEIPRLDGVSLDAGILLFAVGATLLSTVLFGVLPAVCSSTTDSRAALASGGERTVGSGAPRLRGALLLGEIALAVTLLVGAGLLLRSSIELQTQDYGFQPEGVLTAMIDLPSARYPNGTVDHLSFYSELIERVAAVPGVGSVAGSSDLPGGFGSMTFSFAIEGRPRPGPNPRWEAQPLRIVTPDYFRTLGIPLREGRTFSSTDAPDGATVVVINDALRRLHWPDESPVGRRISFEGPEGPWLEIVGVVGDTRHYRMDATPGPALYLPLAQKPWDWASWMNLIVRAEGDPASLIPELRAAVASMDPEIAPGRIEELRRLYAETNARRSFATVLISIFAGLALLLGAIGVHGLLAHTVSRRTGEIGVRIALGASRGRVVSDVVAGGVRLAVGGAVLGVVGALLLSRFLGSLVYGVDVRDPLTFALAPLVMVAVAAVAAWLPARRATRTDPMRALRAE